MLQIGFNLIYPTDNFWLIWKIIFLNLYLHPALYHDLAAHKFTKLSLVEGHINFNDIDILCLSGAFLIDDNR